MVTFTLCHDLYITFTENRQFFPKLWSTSKPKGQPIANHIESALYPNGLGICITEDWKKCLELFDFFHALQPLEVFSIALYC